jgi:hypothetical protein
VLRLDDPKHGKNTRRNRGGAAMFVGQAFQQLSSLTFGTGRLESLKYQESSLLANTSVRCCVTLDAFTVDFPETNFLHPGD